MVSVEEDDLAGLEDVSSDGEDDNYEAELTDGESNSAGATTVRRPYKKKLRADSGEPLPLMEGEGKSFRVLGFNQNQRAAFVQILMRFGVGEFDWKEFTSRMKQKTYQEIKDYGTLFLSHIAEDITDSSTFSDGVPKEGLRIQDVLVRIALLLLIRDKVKSASRNLGTPLFSDDILLRYPGLKGGKIWKEEHDLVLLRAVLKHGYGKWQSIVDDKDIRIQELICQELNLPIINLPVAGQLGSQLQNGTNLLNTEVPSNQSRENGGTDVTADAAQGSGEAKNQTQLYQDSNIFYHFRDMQRRQVEFIKKRVLLLEKGLNAEYQKEYFGDPKANEVATEEPKSEPKATNFPSYKLGDTDTQMTDQLPRLKAITAEETSLACDNDPNRSELVHLYNKMCKVVEENPIDRVRASLARESADVNVTKNFPPLETICEDMHRILTPTQPDQTATDKSKLHSDDCKVDNTVDNESRDMEIELDSAKEGRTNLGKENGQSPILPGKQDDIEMDESKIDGLNDNTEKSDAGVVVLED